MIKIYNPFINEKTKNYAHQAIDSGWISSQGEFIQRAADKLKEVLETENLFLVSNGTTGMNCVSKAVQIRYPNIKTLVVPNNSYVAAWNAFLHDEAFKLISVDCDINTWNYSLEDLFSLLDKQDLHSTALLCVHNLGNIINIDKIKIKYPELLIVEDNCEGLFGKYNGKFSGTQTFASAVSFFGNKTITCGEGGAVVVNDKQTLEYLKSFINQGNTNQRFKHDKLAQNYRLTNIQAALLLGQLESLEEILELKNNVYSSYKEGLNNLDFVQLQKEESNTSHSQWMFGLRFTNGITYNNALGYFNKHGIDIRPMFYTHEKQEYLKHKISAHKTNKNGNLVNAHSIILPSYPDLKREEISYIIEKVKNINKEISK
jgi:perosamine synthetase